MADDDGLFIALLVITLIGVGVGLYFLYRYYSRGVDSRTTWQQEVFRIRVGDKYFGQPSGTRTQIQVVSQNNAALFATTRSSSNSYLLFFMEQCSNSKNWAPVRDSSGDVLYVGVDGKQPTSTSNVNKSPWSSISSCNMATDNSWVLEFSAGRNYLRTSYSKKMYLTVNNGGLQVVNNPSNASEVMLESVSS